MINFTTVNQVSEALEALQIFVRNLTIAVGRGEIALTENGEANEISLIDFALSFPHLNIIRFENDGGVLTIVIDLDDEEFVKYSVYNSEVDAYFNQ